ncbi:MAG: hypothetical protein M1833_004141 [Piccolia ochrophora]|nr:MAG: hypothetical protein M1833_004141 [Piccolia ochrophora]
MRIASTLLLGLSGALVVHADDPPQKPIGSFLEKLSSFVPASLQRGADAGLNKFKDLSSIATTAAAQNIVPLHRDNWRQTLSADPEVKGDKQDEWWVLITGGNKTCSGLCKRQEKAFNESAVIFAAMPATPNQAILDCEKEPILCSSWAAGTRTIWHFLLPRTPEAPTEIRILPLNATTVTATDIVKIYTTQSWKNKDVYDGAFHPIDGWVAKYGLAIPMAYVLYGFAKVPSWLFMVVISFVSRNIMSRRTQPGQSRPAGGQAAPAGN